MKRSRIFSLGVLATFAVACGSQQDVSTVKEQSKIDAAVATEEVVPMFHVKVEPVNAGVNPNAFAYVISADVKTGDNSCWAQGAKAELKSREVNKVTEVYAVLSREEVISDACFAVEDPQFQTVSIEIRGIKPFDFPVYLLNVDTMGHTVNADDLIGNKKLVAPITCMAFFEGWYFDGNQCVQGGRSGCSLGQTGLHKSKDECEAIPKL